MLIHDDGASEPVRLFECAVVHRDPEGPGKYRLSKGAPRAGPLANVPAVRDGGRPKPGPHAVPAPIVAVIPPTARQPDAGDDNPRS